MHIDMTPYHYYFIHSAIKNFREREVQWAFIYCTGTDTEFQIPVLILSSKVGG